jgi:hypothetical protein
MSALRKDNFTWINKSNNNLNLFKEQSQGKLYCMQEMIILPPYVILPSVRLTASVLCLSIHAHISSYWHTTDAPCPAGSSLQKLSVAELSTANSSGDGDTHYGIRWTKETINSLKDWPTGWSRFDPRQGQRIFPVTSVSRPDLGTIQHPVQWVPVILSPGVKSGRGVILTTHPI